MASTTLASLVVRIGADTRDLTKGMSSLDKSIKNTKQGFERLTRSAVTMAGIAGLGFAAKKMLEVGSAAEETASKFRTVFGPATQDAQRFIDEFATSAGLTDRRAQELTSSVGGLAQAFGATQAESAKFAQQSTRLAADLASFHNAAGGTAEVLGAMKSALVGEFEPMKRFDILLKQADVNQTALALSGKKVAATLTQQEKATATLTLMMERAGVAVGDLDRTMGSTANTMRRVETRFGNLRDHLARELLPTLALMVGAVDESGDSFDEMENSISAAFDWSRRFTAGIAIMGAQAAVMAGELKLVKTQFLRIFGKATEADIKSVEQEIRRLERAAREVTAEIVESFDATANMANNTVTLTEKLRAQEDALIANARAAARMNAVMGQGLDRPTLTGDMMDPEKIRARKDRQFFGLRIPMGGVSALAGAGPGFEVLNQGASTFREAVKSFKVTAVDKLGALFDPKQIMSSLASGGITAGIGLVTNFISGFFSNDKAERQRQQMIEAMEYNNRVLEKTSQQLLDQGREKLGAEFDALLGPIKDALTAAFDLFGAEPGKGERGVTLQEALNRALKAAGLDMSQLFQLAGALGVAFDPSSTASLNTFFGAIKKAASGTDEMAEAARKATEALLNIPTGFKIALARFNATEGVDAPARAAGGPVSGGMPYLVGERGPELFVPRSSGGITPNHRLAAGGGGAFDFRGATIHVHGVQDPEQFKRWLRTEAARGGTPTLVPSYVRG